MHFLHATNVKLSEWVANNTEMATEILHIDRCGIYNDYVRITFSCNVFLTDFLQKVQKYAWASIARLFLENIHFSDAGKYRVSGNCTIQYEFFTDN